MWIRFTANHDDRPHRRQLVAYKAGMRCCVTRRCGSAAIAAGKAEAIPTPNRDEAETWRQANFSTNSYSRRAS